MNMVKWTDRKWNFGYTPEYVPLLIERLNCTAPRIEELVKNVPETALSKRNGEHWSVKEHIGHLIDLEELHSGRIDDFKNGAAVLRAADMTNKKTYEANHNSIASSEIIANFRKARASYIEKVKNTAPFYFETKAFHPRLNQQVTLVDMLFFTAEHDNQHLASMSGSLVNSL